MPNNTDELFNEGEIVGLYPHQLNSEFCYKLAHTFFNLVPGAKYVIGYSLKDWSKYLVEAFDYAARDKGVKLEFIGQATLDELLFSKDSGWYDGAIYLTTERFGRNKQGIKLYDKENKALSIDEVKNGFDITQVDYPSDLINNQHQLTKVSYRSKFIEKLYTEIELNRTIDFKVIIDCANGVTGNVFDTLNNDNVFGDLEVEVLHIEANERYPHYLPDLADEHLAKVMKNELISNNGDIGFILNSDGSKFIVVDNTGLDLNLEEVARYIDSRGEQIEHSNHYGIWGLINVLKDLSYNEFSLSKITNLASSINYQEQTSEDIKSKFDYLLDNLWYTWNPHFVLPIIDMYGDGWRKNSPPSEFIAQYGSKKLDEILNEKAFEIEQNVRLFKEYADSQKWFDNYCREPGRECFSDFKNNPIAYFCLEYGLVDWLQIYSGGLGVLAGDFLKVASDMGVPMVAVGIFYHEGYFHQDFAEDGGQVERYIHQDADDYPFELVLDEEGKQLDVMVEVDGREVFARAWKLKVGNVDLYLLDTNYDKNSLWEDKKITAHLYGGDQDTRVRQEILLGIGGARMLKELGLNPSLWHMNEGHSGFLVLELAKNYIDQGIEFKEAIGMASSKLVFTNHTLKQAGNDIFPFVLIEEHLSSYTDDLNTDINSIFELGKEEIYAQGKFSMTMMGLRHAKISNAVSLLHGKAAKRIWPEYDLVPVTNGVHMPTWVSPEIHELLDRYVGENWHYPEFDVDYTRVQNIPDQELWDAHNIRKHKLITTLSTELGLNLDPDALTIAWSRRLASYKRPDMIVSDLDRLRQVLSMQDKPLQILIAGKAHPKDNAGKELVQRMNQALSTEEFKNKVILVPGYNWQLARRMISGADIWLNTPYRFEEASGTSGMKAAANGVLQFTTKDGWTDEVDWYEKGWVIPEEDPVKAMFDTLEYQIMPLFFENLNGEYNEHWVQMMKNCMELVLKNYSMERMMKEYLEKIYLPIITG
ncbi:alpha-glucan family phosphorylase [Candidatus Dojkabacteria bacterium]|uniref:Alpha-glucan family phosphorylase n=1 Tax=Candidatus Dojkabacteria bacterium TaxID=2099670 RepID=A0A955L4B1_9BACT|nr:alpha-glucan family phosphorylase [Candidatus Dojkabacteria bacterium]